MILDQEKSMFSRLSNGWTIAIQLILVLAFCAAAAAILISLGLMRSPAGSHSVQFRVEASGGFAIITLEAGDVSMPEPTTVTAPWTRTIRISSGTEVYLTATNPTQTGKLTCSISLDKVIWKTETTTAPKDGVACAGIVP
jgi:hypothetical protein